MVCYYHFLLIKLSSIKIATNVQVLPKAGYFLMSSPVLKINRITKANKYFIDAAKQVKPEPLLIANCRWWYILLPRFWQYGCCVPCLRFVSLPVSKKPFCSMKLATKDNAACIPVLKNSLCSICKRTTKQNLCQSQTRKKLKRC